MSKEPQDMQLDVPLQVVKLDVPQEIQLDVSLQGVKLDAPHDVQQDVSLQDVELQTSGVVVCGVYLFMSHLYKYK